jgi:serine protease Do
LRALSETRSRVERREIAISGTRPSSAAEKCGLKEGDVIVQMGDTTIGTIYDLTDVLGKAKPGDHVKIVVLRNKQRVELEATLSGTAS